MSITSSAVLVEMNISVWTASKLDRGATNTVINDNNASRDAAQVRKNLMAGTSDRKTISDYAAGCRLWHNTRTLAWADKGPRLLPTSIFLDYKSEANIRRSTFLSMTDKFCAFYPGWLDDQMQGTRSLGGLFDPSDYPSVDEVRGKFDFRLVFSPVPESGDFRVDVPRHDLEDMKQGYDEAFTSRVAEAMRGPWEQLHKMLVAMSDKLTDVPGDETVKRYHDTLVTNAQGLCDLLTHLNVTKDPELERARRDLDRIMQGADIDDIKESAATRSDLKGKLDKILEAYDW
jgi:hypothetical protein